MGAILLKKPEVSPFEDTLSSIPKKTGKGEIYSYATGETCLRIELEGKPPEVIDSYIKKYRDLCDSIYSALKEKGIGPTDEKDFILETYGLLYSSFGIKYEPSYFLSQFIDTLDSKMPEIDCDSSAFLAFDVGKRLGINGLQFVYANEHVLLRTENFGFETTENPDTSCIFRISELPRRYPVIYMSTDDVEKAQSTVFNSRGAAKLSTLDFEGAIADFTEAIRRCPNEANAFNNRGLVKDRLGDYAGAILDFNEAVRIDPLYPDAFNNRGSTKVNLEDYKGAIKDCTQAIKLRPDDSNLYLSRGSAKLRRGDYDGAIEDYEEALEIDSSNSAATSLIELARQMQEGRK